MSLPVTLEPGYCSILEKVSPNGVSASDATMTTVGIVDAIIDTGNNLVSVDQYVWFKINEHTNKVLYETDTYFIVKETDVLMIENPPV